MNNPTLAFGDRLAGTDPRTGDPRDCYFVRISVRGVYQVTDGHGGVWLTPARDWPDTDLLAKPITDDDFRAALASTEAEAVDDWAELPDTVAAQEYLEMARKLGSCPAAHALVDAAERLRRDEKDLRTVIECCLGDYPAGHAGFDAAMRLTEPRER